MSLAYWTFLAGFNLGVALTVIIARLKVRMQVRPRATRGRARPTL